MISENILKQVMDKCIILAEENAKNNQYPIAAIVADREGHLLATSSSSLRERNDPTNHPEIEVIREACEILKSRFLRGYYLFTTLEPCPMCTSAAIWAKMQGIVYGASQEDILEYVSLNPNRKFSWRQIHVRSKDIVRNGYPRLELYEGILQEKCKQLFL
jgi:tRNA(Arg) A34 adenosine deaminase TadA